MTITTVGAAVTNGGTGRSTVNVAPTSAGNIIGMAITSQGATGAVTGLSGGGVTAWTRGTSYFDSVTSSYLDAWWAAPPVVHGLDSASRLLLGLP